MIDPVEPHRAHPPRFQSNGAGNGTGTLPSNDSQPPATPVATRFGQREIELLRQWLADNDSVVEDLRRRLDRATALLADPRPIAEPVERVVEPLRTLRGEFLARRVGR